MLEMGLVPYERFGPVRFGATEDEVVAAMKRADTQLRWSRVERAGLCNLSFRNVATRVELDESGRCERVVVFFDGEAVPVVDGDLRLTGGFEGVVAALRQRGFETRPGPDDVPGLVRQQVCDALGLLVWRDDPWEVDSRWEAS